MTSQPPTCHLLSCLKIRLKCQRKNHTMHSDINEAIYLSELKNWRLVVLFYVPHVPHIDRDQPSTKGTKGSFLRKERRCERKKNLREQSQVHQKSTFPWCRDLSLKCVCLLNVHTLWIVPLFERHYWEAIMTLQTRSLFTWNLCNKLGNSRHCSYAAPMKAFGNS